MTVTPVLADQLEDAGVAESAAPVPGRVADRGGGAGRAGSAGRVPGRLRGGAGPLPARARAARRAGGDPLRAFQRAVGEGRVALAASSATHAVLPLLATREGLRLQLDAGIRSHRRRFGWDGGFWLPECAYAPGSSGAWRSRGCAGSASTRAPTAGPWTRWRPSPPRRGRWRCRSTGRRSSGSGRSRATPPIPPTPSSPANRCAACGSGRSAAAATTRPPARRRRAARRASSSPPPPRACASSPIARPPRPARLRDRHRAARPLVVGGRDLAARGARRRRRRGGAPAHRSRGARRARAGRAAACRVDLGRGQGPEHLGLAGGRRPRLGGAAAGAAAAAGARRGAARQTPRSGRRASCWRRRRATGPSSTSAARQGTTPSSGRYSTPKRPWRP